MLKVHCTCGRMLAAPDESAGRRIRCTKCGAVLQVTDLVGAVAHAMHVPSLASATPLQPLSSSSSSSLATSSTSPDPSEATPPESPPPPTLPPGASAGDVQAAGGASPQDLLQGGNGAAPHVNDRVDWSAQHAAVARAANHLAYSAAIAPSASRGPAYADILAARRWLRVAAVTAVVIGATCLLGAAGAVVWRVVELRGAILSGDALLALITLIGPVALCGLAALAAGAALWMLAAIGAAVRDAARNSWLRR